MPDTRRHRGPHPEDARLFGSAMESRLREATGDLGWLLTRGYSMRSASELVGNRHALDARQRLAVVRCACSEQSAASRKSREVRPEELWDKEVWIDGLNVLTGIEVALSGGVILIGRDGCCRDLAGIHRHYRSVDETGRALRLTAEVTTRWRVSKCRWWLDKPVSNTGRLSKVIEEVGAELKCDWQTELVYSPDDVLSKATQIIASSDSVILDRCERWVNLARAMIAEFIPDAHCIDLSSNDLSEFIAPGAELSKSDCDETDQRELH